MTGDETWPLGGNHALLCGMVAGALLRIAAHDFQLEFESGDDGHLTGRLLVTRPSGVWAVVVVPVDVTEP